MKKIICAGVLTFVIAVSSFGADLQLGFGGGFNYQGTYDMKYQKTQKSAWGIVNDNQFSVFVFFDATYAEADVSFSYGAYTLGFEGFDKTYSGDEFNVELSLLGKYPFPLGDSKFKLFPLIGLSGKFYLGGKVDLSSEEIERMDTGGLGFLGGIGADFDLTDRLYLRLEAMYGVRLWWYSDEDYAQTPGHGPRLKLGVGYSL